MEYISEKKLKKIVKDVSEEFQRHTIVLYEKFRNDVKIIGEGWDFTREKVDGIAKDMVLTNKKVDKISVKLDTTFEMVGDIKEDVEVIKEDIVVMKGDIATTKEDVEIIKTDVSFIKNGLKEKIDKDEFEALEKRVLFLENKFKRV